jgi:cytochrome c-type biogenesis protein
MIESLLTHLSEALEQSLGIAALGAFFWGVISILLSPCHLSSVPLLVGFLSTQDKAKAGEAFRLSTLFALGILASIALIGVLTASAGHLLGNLGKTGNAALALIFFLFGFYLLDLLPLNWGRPGTAVRLRGAAAALGFGFLFGIGLGPCTFAFMAPVLAVVFTKAGAAPGSALCLLGAFALGHCGVIVCAGTLTQSVQRYLNWTQEHRALKWLRRSCGILVVLGGIYVLRRTMM